MAKDHASAASAGLCMALPKVRSERGRESMRGVCMCVCGPPAGGVCNACGAVGPPLPGQGCAPPLPTPVGTGTYHFTPTPLTAEDVRRIFREELERLGVGKSDG